jgi:DNA-binding NtrC family response regulator
MLNEKPQNSSEVSLPTKWVIGVVDDEQGFRDLLSFELGSRGFVVLTCVNGSEAVKCVRENKVDVVVSDVMMSVMNGLEMLANIKEQSPKTEVILLTGNPSRESATESIKKGAYDYLTKPYEVEELARLINRAIEKHRLNRPVD